jgi:hypothetical protein
LTAMEMPFSAVDPRLVIGMSLSRERVQTSLPLPECKAKSFPASQRRLSLLVPPTQTRCRLTQLPKEVVQRSLGMLKCRLKTSPASPPPPPTRQGQSQLYMPH